MKEDQPIHVRNHLNKPRSLFFMGRKKITLSILRSNANSIYLVNLYSSTIKRKGDFFCLKMYQTLSSAFHVLPLMGLKWVIRL
jgi:hypothetical protein